MRSETRQTLIGVTGLTIVFTVALWQGLNGHVAMSYGVTVLGLIAPEALDNLRIWSKQ